MDSKSSESLGAQLPMLNSTPVPFAISEVTAVGIPGLFRFVLDMKFAVAFLTPQAHI